MNDELLGFLREALGVIKDERSEGRNSRELSIIATKVEESIMWRQSELARKREILNEGNDKG